VGRGQGKERGQPKEEGEGPSGEEVLSEEVRLGGRGAWLGGGSSAGSELKADGRGLGADGEG
jgi:hypothetical protein